MGHTRSVYCGSTSTEKATWRKTRSRAAPSTAAATAAIGGRPLGRLDHHLEALAAAQAEQRRGPEHVGARAPPRPRPPGRPPPARPARPRPGRRPGSGRRTAGSAAPRGGRARRPRSPACRAATPPRSPARPARWSGRARARRAARARRGPASWAISANVRSSARKSGKRRVESASSTTPSVTSGKSWPLATICVPSSSPRGAASNRASSRGTASLVARRVGVEPEHRDVERLGRAPPRSARCPPRSARPPASRRRRSGRGTRSRWPQWWQAIAPCARCSTSATSHCGHSQTFPHVRQVRKFDQPRRLSSTIALCASPSARRVSGCSGCARPAHVEHAHGRQRAPVGALAQLEPRQRVPGLRPRRGGADQQRGARPPRALGGHAARVVARVALVLVGGVVLLVDHHEPEPLDGREHRRARPDRDPRLAGAQPPPLVVALALAERGVQQRDGVAEARLEAPDRLRGQRDLRHEHDHALPALERPRRGAQVDLGLARAGDAVQEVLAARLDRPQRRRLRVGQLDRLVDRRPRQRLAPLGARLDRHQPALLEPPQRARGPRPPGPAAARAARAGARSAARRRALASVRERPQPQSAACRPAAARARAPAPASRRTPPPSTARARRGRRGTESSRTALGATSRSGGSSLSAASPTTTPSSFWWPNGTRTTDPTSSGASGQRVVERARSAGGWW